MSLRIICFLLSLLVSSASANAELKRVEAVGAWTLMEDSDPIFGPLSYAISLKSDTDNGSSELIVECDLSGSDPGAYSWGINLRTSLFEFSEASQDIVATSMLKFDDEGVFQVNWLGMQESHEAAFASNNISQNDNSEEFTTFINDLYQSADPADAPFNDLGSGFSGLSRFAWNLQTKDVLALGFTVGRNRVPIIFKPAGSRAAMSKLFTRCGAAPSDASERSSIDKQAGAREEASWTRSHLSSGYFDRYEDFPLNGCFEVQWLKRIRSDPVVVIIEHLGGEMSTIKFTEKSKVFEGPFSALIVHFGENRSEGEYAYRTWHNQGVKCIEAN